MKIKKITIENFRGIKRPLTLDFIKNERFTSVSLYGLNGNGKSSIVDAWEWLYSNKIEHLAREGAAAKEFPHKSSKGEDCYIEVEFDIDELSILRQEYNRNRITQPIITGNHDLFKTIVKHPCHLRYRDLQTFVYFKKAERYTYLAKYLGFEKQLQIQENFITYRNKLRQREGELQKIQLKSLSKLREILDVKDEIMITDELVINFANRICTEYSISRVASTTDLQKVQSRLKNFIQKDPKTEELTHRKSLKSKINQFKKIIGLEESYSAALMSFKKLKENEANISKLLILNLYKVGLDLINEGENICPLCNNPFQGDLKKHIGDKHIELYSLKNEKEGFEDAKMDLTNKLDLTIRNLELTLESKEEYSEFQSFFNVIELVKAELYMIQGVVNKNISEIEEFPDVSKSLIQKISNLNAKQEEIKRNIDIQIQEIEKDETRQKLADNYDDINQLISVYKDFVKSKYSLAYFLQIKDDFEFILANYIDWVKEKIQDSFNLISNNVVEYFKILESNNPNISNPHITLLSDKDKAVELEIEFASERIKPAFKVLSESQINSFGLAIFLAAIRQFNVDFKFIILDDVVNSFDAYKRPKVIELLNRYFSDFQFLILTHDQIWFDRLQRTFKNWNRKKFSGWDYNLGPKVQIGKNIFEEVEDNLEKDNPIIAGQILGRYLEWVLQELNQNLETPIKYKFDNQYTLGELFDCFKARISKKLKTDNFLYKSLDSFSEDTIFRNYCAHWKGTNTDFTSPEIRDIFEKWKKIESILYCEECNMYVLYNSGKQEIICTCRKLNLRGSNFYPAK